MKRIGKGNMKKLTDYEIKKQENKQKLVKNEFLYHNNSQGEYDFPIIKKQQININNIEFLSYVNAKNNDKENSNKTIHFYTYDWLFNKVYENAEEELEKLSQYYCLLSPDFSIFTNMPLALQIQNVFKNRWCGAYWQSKGLKVIPCVSWGDERSFDFCFDGIEEGSIVAVCTYYRENCEEEFMLGYNEMLKRIKPSMVLCYDEPFSQMKGNIIEFLPTTYEYTKNLKWEDLVQFKWEKKNRSVSGLNPKDFKFFKYEDYMVKDQKTKCPVCDKVAYKDQYGNGECYSCGWLFSKNDEEIEKFLKVSYPMLVPTFRAREQYQNGLKFKATFEDFINGLLFYSEMTFKYKGKNYGTFYYGESKGIEFFEDKAIDSQLYKTVEEYKNKANIDGKLLKDIWGEIESPSYMYCGE